MGQKRGESLETINERKMAGKRSTRKTKTNDVGLDNDNGMI